MERQHNIVVKKFRLDNGGEFVGNYFKNFCKQKGITLEYTMAYTPQQNGKSERMNRTLLNKIRIKIIESGIPKYLWDEALKCSVYEINRTPSKAIPKVLTPAYIRHGHSDLKKLRIFGCRAWVTILPKGTKLDARSKRGVMVGYCGGGYRI